MSLVLEVLDPDVGGGGACCVDIALRSILEFKDNNQVDHHDIDYSQLWYREYHR